MKTSFGRKLFLWMATIAVGIPCNTLAQAQSATGGWTNRYNGPGNSTDVATAIAVVNSGNVVITGASIGSGSGYDFATVKYSAAGVPLWINRYNGPGNGPGDNDDQGSAVAVDSIGDVFVTGYSRGSGGTLDYATIKYSGAGVPLWTNRYTSGAATALAVDGSDNVIVTGHSTGDGTVDYVTIKYSGAGVPLWTNRYDGPVGDDLATAVAVDGGDNVVVTGVSYNDGPDFDYATIKYSGAGVPLWTNHFFGVIGSLFIIHFAPTMGLDTNGNVFVAFSAGGDYVTIKYSDAGVPLWTNRYDGLGDYNEARAVAVDGSGNVFVTGTSAASGGALDYATIAYSNSGVPLWTNRYDRPEGGNDYATAVAVDGRGNVFVTGYSYVGGLLEVFTTIKYSSTGLPLWTNRYIGPANSYDRPNAMAVDSTGNVFVTGISEGSGSGWDYTTIKYSSASNPLLAIARTVTNTLVLSWPSAAADFTLQQNTNGIVTSSWFAVTDVIQDDGANKYLVIEPATGNRFYRLSKP